MAVYLAHELMCLHKCVFSRSVNLFPLGKLDQRCVHMTLLTFACSVLFVCIGVCAPAFRFYSHYLHYNAFKHVLLGCALQ